LSMFRAVENGVARPQDDAHVLFAVCRLTLPMGCPPLTPKQSLHARASLTRKRSGPTHGPNLRARRSLGD
jgi:hypothetical protein